jgi:hypothetical protein
MKLAAACALTASLISLALPALSAPDKEFDAFWTKFKAALQKNDKNAVADMTKLPYLFDSKNLNRQQFIQQYPKLFPASTRKCLQSGKPVKDKDCYMVFCGEEIFIFAKSGKNYAFTEIGVND